MKDKNDTKGAEDTKGVVLKFVGGDAYLPGLPASDLTQEQVDSFVVWGLTTGVKALIKTGLYAPVDTPASPAHPDTSARTHARSKGKE